MQLAETFAVGAAFLLLAATVVVVFWIGIKVIRQSRPRGHDCLNDCWDLRTAVLDITQLMQNDIKDLQQALINEHITIPWGYGVEERQKSIAKGMQILFPDGPPEGAP